MTTPVGSYICHVYVNIRFVNYMLFRKNNSIKMALFILQVHYNQRFLSDKYWKMSLTTLVVETLLMTMLVVATWPVFAMSIKDYHTNQEWWISMHQLFISKYLHSYPIA